jgi:hypothetical protein
MIRLKMSGDDLDGWGEEMMEGLRPWATDVVRDGAGILRREAGKVLRSSRPRAGDGAAPGQPPAMRSGELAGSIREVPPFWTGDVVRAGITTDSPYAARMEWGFRATDVLGRVYNQAPRPWLAPAVRLAAPAINARMER